MNARQPADSRVSGGRQVIRAVGGYSWVRYSLLPTLLCTLSQNSPGIISLPNRDDWPGQPSVGQCDTLEMMIESTAKILFTTKGTKEHEVFFKQLCAQIQDFQLSLSEILCVLCVLCGSILFSGESWLNRLFQTSGIFHMILPPEFFR